MAPTVRDSISRTAGNPMPEVLTGVSTGPERPNLRHLGGVPETYAHHQRLVTPGDDLVLPRASLKWYEIRREEAVISPQVVQASREFVRQEIASDCLPIVDELGFALLHLADSGERRNVVALLIVAAWRHANELWRTAYAMDLTRERAYQPLVTGAHTPTFCVWELGPIWHEQQAWVRFLHSPRDDVAKQAYLNDRFAGLV